MKLENTFSRIFLKKTHPVKKPNKKDVPPGKYTITELTPLRDGLTKPRILVELLAEDTIQEYTLAIKTAGALSLSEGQTVRIVKTSEGRKTIVPM